VRKPLPPALTDWSNGWPSFDRHLFLVPDAQLLAVLPASKDRLVLHRCNLEQLLEQSGVDYLFVPSRPPAVAVRGRPYVYAVAVRSKKGGAKVKLEAGPAGMKLSPGGALAWDVPKDFADPEAGVVLTVSDATGQEVFHTFQAAVQEPGAGGGEPAPEK
jgi:hypothetical protein